MNCPKCGREAFELFIVDRSDAQTFECCSPCMATESDTPVPEGVKRAIFAHPSQWKD